MSVARKCVSKPQRPEFFKDYIVGEYRRGLQVRALGKQYGVPWRTIYEWIWERKATQKKPDRVQKFWSRVRKTSGCWVWTGKQNPSGYGIFQGERAHRFSWELAMNKKVPKGMLVCHTCDFPPCVKFTHLFLGTKKDNLWDCVRKGRRNTKLK